MKTYFVALFILCCLSCDAQNRYNDNLTIYNRVLSLYKHGNKLILDPKTSLQTLKHFDFKNPANHLLKPDTLSEDWQCFLSGVDTASFRENPVNNSLVKKYPDKKETKGSYIFLSPIIFSKDRKKAVCAVRDYGSSLDSSEQVYLLEKKDNSWKIIKSYMISIS